MNEWNYIDFVARLKQGNPSPGGLALLRQSLSGIPRLSDNANILEIGSNTGASLACLSECFPDNKVIGIDISPEMITQAKRYIKELQDDDFLGKNVNAEVDDAESLSFKNESFELVVSGGTLSFVSNPELAIREIDRVLKPGGTFLSLEYCYLDENEPPEELKNELKNILGFDLSKFTLEYWNNVHSADNLSIEGLQVYKPYIHRAKDINKTVELVEFYNKNRGESISEQDKNQLIKALKVFKQNESYTNLAVFTCRKWGGTKLLTDVMN